MKTATAAPNKRRRGRGEGSIFKLPDGRWRAVVSLGFDSQGRRRRKNVEGMTRTDVREKLLTLQSKLKAGEPLTEGRDAIADWIVNDWLPVVRARRRGSTYVGYKSVVSKYLVPWLKKRTFAQIRAADLERWYIALKEDGVGERTVLRIHAAIRTAFGYAVRTEVTTRNVAAMIEPPAYAPKPRHRYSIEEAVRFLNAIEDHPAEALFVAALFVQMRGGELLALRWSDVDLETATITVERTMTLDDTGRTIVGTTTKTRAGQRRIIMPRIAVDALRRHRDRLEARGLLGELIFPARMSQPGGRRRAGGGSGPVTLQNVGRYWLHPLQRAAGVREITFHDLRHTGASILRERGGDLIALRDRLGHESIGTTANVYIHLDLSAQKTLSDSLDTTFMPLLGKTKSETVARASARTAENGGPQVE